MHAKIRGMASLFLAFLGVSLMVIVTPGQDTALVIRNTLAGGRRSGVFTALGIVAGQIIWALAASAGVAALIVASEPAFVIIKLAGAAYLVFCTLALAWLTGYAFAVAKAGDFLRRPTVRRAVEGVMGAALVALGLRLATEHR